MTNQPRRSTTLQQFGHAPGHLRDALIDALEYGDDWWKHIEIEFYNERHSSWWKGLSRGRRAEWLLGQLWNCTDVLPSGAEAMRDVEMPHGNSYAALVRVLAREIKSVQGEN